MCRGGGARTNAHAWRACSPFGELGFKSQPRRFSGPVDQPGRSPPWRGGGLGFKSRRVHHSLF